MCLSSVCRAFSPVSCLQGRAARYGAVDTEGTVYSDSKAGQHGMGLWTQRGQSTVRQQEAASSRTAAGGLPSPFIPLGLQVFWVVPRTPGRSLPITQLRTALSQSVDELDATLLILVSHTPHPASSAKPLARPQKALGRYLNTSPKITCKNQHI